MHAMKIRYKILLILVLVTFILLVSLLTLSQTAMLSGVYESEKQHSTQNAERFERNFDIALSSLNSTVKDWAIWDETYNFVKDNNTAYQENNLNDPTFKNLQINMMLFFDQSGAFVYGKLYNLSSNTVIPFDNQVISRVQNYSVLFSNDTVGLILLDNLPMLVASHSILTNEQEGPSHGTMIIGRYLDTAELSLLSSTTGLPLSYNLIDDTSMSAEYSLALENLSTEHNTYTKPLNETHIAGYVLIGDVSGDPLIIVQAIDYRTEYVLSISGLTYFYIFLVMVLLIVIAVIAFLLEKVVISRISDLNDTVTDVRKRGKQKRVIVKGEDELSNLGKNINGMLDEIGHHTSTLEQTVAERTKDLVENRKRLESILQASPDAIVTIGLDGKIIELNARVCELSGFSREELIGQNSLLFVSENRREKFHQEASAILNSPGPLRFEIYFLKKDGAELPVEFSINLIRDEDDRPVGIVGIIRDLSEKKALEQRLIQSQRLAAIGELSGMIAHDIRNPLAAIRNADYYLKRKCSGRQNSEVAAMFSIIDKSIDHANSIINDLLEYSVELRLLLVQSTPKRLMAKALQVMLLPSNIQLVDLTTDVPFKVDETKVVRVFTNLIKNAIDAMPAGGTLEVKSWQENGYVHISFSDTGEGIPPDTLKKLFTPLFTTKAQGMGFGLSISKRIVEAHGGKISVDSRQGQGTTFTVTFPLEPKLNAHDRAGFADRLTSDSSDPI